MNTGLLVFTATLFASVFSEPLHTVPVSYQLYGGNFPRSAHLAGLQRHSSADSLRHKRQEATPTPDTVKDNHVYYTSIYHPPGDEASRRWFELSNLIGSGVDVDDLHMDKIFESTLGDLHRFVHGWRLPFNFTYYGHTLDTVYVTTGGFLYVGTFLHPGIVALTQTISPLKADFNPSLNETGRVLIYRSKERFTVQWDQVHNHDHVQDGPFTFQVSLFPNGDIHFVYREIPLEIDDIDNDSHPVEVGLSDAFYVDRRINQEILRTVYEYHRVDLEDAQDLSYSAYVITPLESCIMANNCQSCNNISQRTAFTCSWCETLNRCSDGVDRHRQEWFTSGCIDNAVMQCRVPIAPSVTPLPVSPTHSMSSSQLQTPSPSLSPARPPPPTIRSDQLSGGAVGGIVLVGVVIGAVVLIAVVLVVLFVHAYRHPDSSLGQFFHEHRKIGGSSAKYEMDSDKVILQPEDDEQ